MKPNKLAVLALLFCIAVSLNAWDERNPIDVVNIVELPYQIGLLIPISALLGVIFWTEPPVPHVSEDIQNVPFKYYFGTSATYCQSYHEDLTDVFVGTNALSYQLRDFLAVSAQGHGIILRDSRISSKGLGGSLGQRWTFLRYKKFSMFYDWSLGMVMLDKAFPPSGTEINFLPSNGLGVSYQIKSQVWFTAGFQHIHISNAGLINGSEHNPGFDSNGCFAGYSIQW